ncbi:MAG: nuclear transport factor 2 family protein [Bacteroidota bacterium]
MNLGLNQRNKQLVWNFWQVLDQAAPSDYLATTETLFAPDVRWYGFDPVNNLSGCYAFSEFFWKPFKVSFPDLKRETHIFIGGVSNGRKDGDISKDGHYWVSGTGYFHATFTKDYLTIPANGQSVKIRWGEFCKLENGKITEIYFLLDLIDLMQQVGIFVLPPSKGKDNLYPPPAAKDGIQLTVQDITASTYSLDHIWRFIYDGLNAFDQDDLKSMGMADYFHPEVQWYGPGGIGACLNFKEFETFHQQPWLTAYPDREVQDLDALIAEGNYSGGPGWAGVIAAHTGPYLNVPATGNTIKFNGLDWWKRDGEQYIENWVFVDMIHLFRQFGVDLLKRMK